MSEQQQKNYIPTFSKDTLKHKYLFIISVTPIEIIISVSFALGI